MMNIQNSIWFALGLSILTLLSTHVRGQLWTVANSSPTDIEEGSPVECNAIEGLSRNQKSLCKRYNDHMFFVAGGASIGLQECKWQMRSSRWNCTAAQDTSPEKAISVGSRETAFSFAITAAGVVHKLARACKMGQLKACGCSQKPRPAGLGKDWNWGGCGDDTDYAYGFAHEFIDARERESTSPQDHKVRSRKSMNIHNNEAGRMAVIRATRPTCKCHGVSGSCSIKTCWLQIPDFREVGDKLRKRFDSATEMRATNRGHLRTRLPTMGKPSITDLVYIDSSPDYCRPNRKMGVLGTSGRECSVDSEDGCDRMCCGRGHITREVEIVKSCNCKFQWCCFVKCQNCRERVLKHICI